MQIGSVNNFQGSASILQFQYIERELTNLRQAIIQDNPTSRLNSLLNEAERLYQQGNFVLAQRKLAEAKNTAEEDGILPNPLQNQQGIQPETIEPNIPEPIVPKQELPGETPQETPILPATPEIKEDIPAPQFVSRTYQDVSNDIGASFQAPTPLNELEARVRIPAHERGHIIRAIAKALVHRKEIKYAYFTLNWKPDYKHVGFYLKGGVAKMKINGPIVELTPPKLDIVS